jgi:hypothetical protein
VARALFRLKSVAVAGAKQVLTGPKHGNFPDTMASGVIEVLPRVTVIPAFHDNDCAIIFMLLDFQIRVTVILGRKGCERSREEQANWRDFLELLMLDASARYRKTFSRGLEAI